MQPIKPTVMNYQKPMVQKFISKIRTPFARLLCCLERESVSSSSSRRKSDSATAVSQDQMRVVVKNIWQGFRESTSQWTLLHANRFSFHLRGEEGERKRFLASIYLSVCLIKLSFRGLPCAIRCSFSLVCVRGHHQEIQKNEYWHTAKNAETNNRITVMINLN